MALDYNNNYVRDKLREVRVGGHRLVMWATDKTDWRGQIKIAYQLSYKAIDGKRVVVFEGADFCGSPLHADDSDETVKSLLHFLTLRPGDTDSEYFQDYTAEQVVWCTQHAEGLSCAVYARFGE